MIRHGYVEVLAELLYHVVVRQFAMGHVICIEVHAEVFAVPVDVNPADVVGMNGMIRCKLHRPAQNETGARKDIQHLNTVLDALDLIGFCKAAQTVN